MRFKGYDIKPTEGKRIGKGPVSVQRRGRSIDTYPNLTIAKQKINLHLNRWKNYYDPQTGRKR